MMGIPVLRTALLASAVVSMALTAGPSVAATTVINVWDQFFSEGPNKLMDEFVSEFEAAHPGVEIKRNVLDTDSIRATLPSALASGQGPDIFYYDAGPAFLGPLVEAGLVADLTKEYAARGWDKSLVAWPVERVTYNNKIWGVPNEIEYTNVYVNLEVLDQLGMKDKLIPAKDDPKLLTLKSLDDYKAILDAAKAKGLVPIAFGNRDPGRGGHLFSYFLTLTAGKDFVDSILFGNGRWDDAKVVDAWKLYKAYSDDGFYPPSPNAISYDEGNALFFNGQAATNVTGTWLVGDIMDQVADPSKFDFILLPPASPDLPLSAAAGIGSTFAVAEKSPNKALALDFLDFIMSKDAGKRWLTEASIVPPVKGIDIEGLNLPLMMQRVVQGANLPLSYNLDVVMPAEWNDAMKTGTQSLLDGSSTPDEVAAKMEAAWEKAKTEGRIWKAH
jgi:raffinose/stachyose/melibiose transport system substrate-binding protein